MGNVQRHGLFGQQVHWNGITAESIKDDDIKFLELPSRCFSLEGKAGVAQHNVNCGGRVLHEAEPWFLPQRKRDHLRINFVKPEIISVMSVSRHRACSETYHTYPQGASLPARIEGHWIAIQNEP